MLTGSVLARSVCKGKYVAALQEQRPELANAGTRYAKEASAGFQRWRQVPGHVSHHGRRAQDLTRRCAQTVPTRSSRISFF
jgi:hypothetical protein